MKTKFNHIWYIEERKPGDTKWYTLIGFGYYKSRSRARDMAKNVKSIWPKTKFRVAHFLRMAK